MKWFDKLFRREQAVSRHAAPPTNSTQKDPSEYSPDLPIKDPTSDRFGRWAFARQLALGLSRRLDGASLVVALYGKWGSGKTTVLNFIASELAKHPKVIVLQFNAWRFPSEAEQLVGFYNELAKALDASLPTAKEKLGKFIGGFPAAFAGLLDRKEGVDALARLLSTVSLEELRDRVGDLLREEQRLLVVLMDDIDRLDKNEIQSIFRLIKLSANFENLIYVLAFDRQIVVQALNERYYSDVTEPGQNFLEKIVQVPIDLPAIPGTELRAFCFDLVDAALQSVGVVLTEAEVQEFAKGFITGVEIRLDTPRVAIRYSNMLRFTLPLVRDEVHSSDFLLVEAIRAFYPAVYECMRNNRQIFTGENWAAADILQSDKDRAKRIVDATLNSLSSEDHRAAIRSLLLSLFPRLQTIYSNVTFGGHWEEEWRDQKRVTSLQYFDRYFAFSVPAADTSDVVVKEFTEALPSMDATTLNERLGELLSPRRAESFITKVARKLDSISDPGKALLALCLAPAGTRLPNSDQAFAFSTPFSRGALLIARLVRSLQGTAERNALATKVVAAAEPLTFAVEILSWLRSKGDDIPAMEQAEISSLSTALAERIAASAADETFLTAHGNQLPRLLLMWSKFGPGDLLHDYLTKHVYSSAENATKLLVAYVPIAYPLDGSPSHPSDFGRDEYNNLASFVDINTLHAALEAHYGQSINAKDYPHFDNQGDSQRIVKQFAWIHRSATKPGPSSDDPAAMNVPSDPPAA
jgi:hypothetical protein